MARAAAGLVLLMGAHAAVPTRPLFPGSYTTTIHTVMVMSGETMNMQSVVCGMRHGTL